MGLFSSSSSKTITETTTVVNTVVKLSYLQTLATAKSLVNLSDFETASFDKANPTLEDKNTLIDPGVLGNALSKVGLGPIGDIVSNLPGFGHSSTTVYQNLKSSGAKVKDTWNQSYFDRISYKLGVKEMSVSRYIFAEASEFTSTVWGSPKEIAKVSVIVDEYIPSQFDTSKTWIKYFIKVEGEKDWVRINPMNKPTIFDEEGLIVPRILNYNLPKPSSAQIEDKYQYTDTEVRQFRIRVVMMRPSGSDTEASITPLLKSYRIAMQPLE